MQQLNVNTVARRQYPNWNLRAKVRKTDDQGNILPNEYAFGGEIVRVSPRFQKHGTNFRIRPERPAFFFMQFCVENGLLPVALTAEECESEIGLEILQPLFETYKQYLPRIESPFAACDQVTEPSLKEGFSFCILQVLVDQIGTVRTAANRSTPRPTPSPSTTTAGAFDNIKKRIDEMRARTAKPESPAPAKKK
jgi:hypothetical protein